MNSTTTHRTGRAPSAREQFTALGIVEEDYTPAMRLAVKQKWSGLPVDAKVADLRDQLANVEKPVLPTVEMLQASGFPDEDAAHAELARLKRNAGVQVWRARNQIQAALDARDLRFKQMRAAKGSKKAGGSSSRTHAAAGVQ